MNTTYEYKFATETVEVEISEEWAEILRDMAREEYNNNQKETRRSEPYGDEGEWAIDRKADIDYVLEQKEMSNKFDRVMGSLTEKQRDFVENVFMDSESKQEYAKRKNVGASAISERKEAVKRKFKKVF